MEYIFGRNILIACSIIGLALSACSAQQPLLPAAVDIVSLRADAEQVSAGSKVTVIAEVSNTGGLPGNFDEPLMVNGKQVDEKAITVQPGASKTLTYTVTLNKKGDNTIRLGSMSVTVQVMGMKEQEVELKYDNGNADDALWAGNNGGFMVCFDPPDKPFVLKKVRICAGIYGVGWDGKSFRLIVLDSDMKSAVYDEEFAMARLPVRSAYPYQPPQWVDFNLPVTTFNDKFYVYLYANSGQHRGVHVGVDGSVVNEGSSSLAQGTPPVIVNVEPTSLYPRTIWYSDIMKINWMIRAEGTALVPE